MDPILGFSRALPLFASLPIAAAYFVILFLQISREREPATRFLIFAVGARLLLSAFFYITFQRSPLGLSWNAVGTIAIIGIGGFVIRPRRLFDPFLMSVAPLIAIIIASACVNSAIPDGIAVLAKYGYFCVVVMAMVDALNEKGGDYVLRSLLIPLSAPFVFQIASIVLGVYKEAEGDGAPSYIGGFNHEASFSITICAATVVLCFIRRMDGFAKAAMIVWTAVAILFANYRTAVLALAPLLGIVLLTGIPRRFVAQQRALVVGLMVFAVAALGTVAAIEGSDRYGDVAVVAERGTSIIKPPREFTPDDRHLMSGRALIWSEYLYAYADGTPLQKMIGFGGETWSGRFRVYAHNTLVSTLYEFGVFGVAAMLFFWIRMLLPAFRAPREVRIRLVAAHVTFLILTMATMPLWIVEGLMLYGMLCGYTLHMARARRAVRHVPRPAFGQLQPTT